MPNRYRLKGASLEEIQAKARAQYGPAARIVSAERVISPGIAGMFAANRYEAVVELQPRHDVVTGEVVPDADVLNADGDGAPAATVDSVPAAPAPASDPSSAPDSSSPSVPAAPSVPGAPAAAPQPASTAPSASPAAPAAEEPGRKSRRKAAKAAKSGRAAKTEPAASATPAPPAGAAGGAAPGPAASATAPGEQARVSAPGHALQGGAIAALLAEADAAEMTMHRPAQPALSTETPGFAELLNQLGSGLQPPSAAAAPAPARAPQPAGAPSGAPAGTAPGAAAAGARTAAVSLLGPAEPAESARRTEERSEAPAAPKRIPAPVPLRGTGDLVVLVGLGDDPLDTALDMSIAAGGADVRTAGELSAYGHLHLDGRQSATAARAHAVETEQTVIAAFGLGKGRHALARLQALAALSPDQVWVVVDAGRKTADTARWINLVRSRLEIDAMAVVGAAYTSSPETVEALNIAVGWIDGKPAGHPLPWAAADGSEG
ncbi:hypothetical protein QWJ39_15335 [Arthrobacter sp. YD4]|uniref:hypothetical protein n=1 Tax=Arthrobacter sp. YD4 TaxID=3058043 RepID=UPI0025B2840C|nr:hypothetical protein [Arthrobacter sp. YD4]MDN3937678.1 hypothetical protein [Arthrobacter sp. YD4]